MKKYTIVLRDASDLGSFVNDMRSSSAPGRVPQRPCVTSRVKGTRCVMSEITEEEAETLLGDPRVKSVNLDGSFKVSSMGAPSDSTLSLVVGTETICDGDVVRRRIRHSVNRRVRSNSLSIQSLDKYASIDGLPEGSGVDVVVVDGVINPNNAEMKSKSGVSRVKNVNWNVPSGLPGTYSKTYDENDINDNHGQHVAGICCGLVNGWAKGSDIYNVYAYDENLTQYLVGIKNWHSVKTNGNPTVANNSYGILWDGITDVRYILSVNINGTKITAPRSASGAVVTTSINSEGGALQYNVNSGGSGYTNPPDVSFYGGGRDSAVAQLGENSVYEINVTNSGSGYIDADPPVVTFGAAPSGGVRATGRCEVVGGKISKVVMINRGRGYSSAPSITFGPPEAGGTQATGTVTIDSKFITNITITNGGSGHTENLPSIILSGGGCSVEPTWVLDNAQFQASAGTGVLQNGLYKIAEKIDNLSPSSFRQTPMGGSYLTAPVVSFFYGPGSPDGPYARAVISGGSVVGVVGVSQGVNYSSAPSVVVTNGGGFTPNQLRNWGVGDVQQGVGGDSSNHYVFNTPQRNSVIDSIVEDMIDEGIIFVAAAGNSGSRVSSFGDQGYDDNFEYLTYTRAMANPAILEEPNPNAAEVDSVFFARGMSPSAANGAICVGSLSSSCCPETKSAFSNAGTRVDLYAPGGRVMSSVHYSGSFGVDDGGQVFAVQHPLDSSSWMAKFSGTNQASPQVAGAIACYAEGNRNLDQSGALAWLTSNAKAGVSEGAFPYSRFGGQDRVLHYPGLTVTVQS